MSEILTEQEIQVFFEHVEAFRKLPIRLIYESGLRLVEVVDLKVDQVDLRKMVFLLKNRKAPIPPRLKPDLAKLIKDKKNNDFVFSRGCSTRNLNRQIKQASEAAGIRVTSGMLMKAFAFHLLKRGHDWESVKRVSSYTPDSFRTLIPRKDWKKIENCSV
jgi:integrase